jgi:hypothetical protein
MLFDSVYGFKPPPTACKKEKQIKNVYFSWQWVQKRIKNRIGFRQNPAEDKKGEAEDMNKIECDCVCSVVVYLSFKEKLLLCVSFSTDDAQLEDKNKTSRVENKHEHFPLFIFLSQNIYLFNLLMFYLCESCCCWNCCNDGHIWIKRRTT